MMVVQRVPSASAALVAATRTSPRAAEPLDRFALSDPRPDAFWRAPVLVGASVASGACGALAGLSVRLLGPWGIPAGLAAGALLGGGTLGALSVHGDNTPRESARLAALGVASGMGAALVGGAAACFTPWPVLVGAGSAALAGLAVSGWLAARD